MKSLLVLGRQPDLGLAELESLYTSDKVERLANDIAVVDVDPCLLAFDRLGGSIKFAKLLTTLDASSWGEAEKFLINVSPEQSKSMPEGKMYLGLSAHGFDITPEKMMSTALKLKKTIQKTDRSVRVIPNKTVQLNAAQIINNKLLTPNGWELLIIKAGQQITIAQTIKVQDIDAYAKRDQLRPKRDSKVGMLPPKLAQMIINLGSGVIPQEALSSICDIPADQPIPLPILNKTVLDPFCGSGVIPQEALLMGYKAYATDVSDRMVEYTQKNMEWLGEEFKLDSISLETAVIDAVNGSWGEKFDFIASESYLGTPYYTVPTHSDLSENMNYCNQVISGFLKNIHKQIPTGFRICLAIPAWQIKPDIFEFLPLIDQIGNLGYNLVKFKQVTGDKLLYYRPNQVVARQLIVIARN